MSPPSEPPASEEMNYVPRRQPVACRYCHEKKVRCNGERPCVKCQRDGIHCVYAERRQKRATRVPTGDIALKKRMDFLEQELLRLTGKRAGEENALAASPGTVDDPSLQENNTTEEPRWEYRTAPGTRGYSEGRLSSSDYRTQGSFPTSPSHSARNPDSSSASIQNKPDLRVSGAPQVSTSALRQYSPTTWIRSVEEHTTTNNFYTPPCSHSLHAKGGRIMIDMGQESTSYSATDQRCPGLMSSLSLCSSSGQAWVGEKCSDKRFKIIAEILRQDPARQLGLNIGQLADHFPQPDKESAFAYTEAYFEKSTEVAFAVLNRATFESRLNTQFETSQRGFVSDPAWYAKCNVVYAAGCRVLLSRLEYSSTFIEARETSQKYFTNALSVLPALLSPRMGLEAIRALLLMSVHATAFHSPALDHVLISNAVRLAQSSNLHRQMQADCSPGNEEDADRCWLFWSIYCLEKNIAFAHGLDSIIDDDTITCPMPKQVALGYLIYPEFRLHCLGYAKLASAIMSMLKTSNLARFSATELAETIHMLDTQFATWRDSLPRFARPSKDHNLQDIPTNWNPQLVEYLRCACHALVLSIHSTLAHPWIVESLCPCICRRLTDQIQRSTMLVAELSREVIMTSNSMDITASTPSWQVFRLPMAAAVNLFALVVGNPGAQTSMSDVALLDVAAGHLGHLDYVCASDISSPVARELANIARTAVKAVNGTNR